MKAYFYEGDKKFRLGDTEIKAPGPNQVVLKIAYCGVCGSDVHMANGEWEHRVAPLPRIIGHEASGEIVQVGEAVTGWKVGDRAVVRPLESCGVCPACKSGNDNICKDVKYLGIEVDGAFQNYWTVNADILHRCPDGLSLLHAALVEPLAVCCHAVQRSGVESGGTAVVIGGGPIGLMTALILKGRGVNVTVSELSAIRLENCRKMGVPCLNPSEENLEEYVAKMTGGYGVDVVFEASGSQPGLATAPTLCHPGGCFVTVATYAKPMQVEFQPIHFRELKVITTRAYQARDFEEALELMNKKLFDCDALISKIFPLERLEEAIAASTAGADVVKVMVDCQSVQ